MSRPRCITVDELHAAGALDVPAEWRRSLSAGTAAGEKRHNAQRELFPESDDDDARQTEPRAGAEPDA